MAYKDGRYREIFNAARSNALNPEEIVTYSQSLEKLRDTKAGIVFAADKARAEGEKKKLKQIVITLRRKGFDDIVIADMLNESIDTISLIS